MPSLDPEDRERLLVVEKWTCPKCGKHPRKNYCRECDEFFWICDCPPEPNDPNSIYHTDHTGHRTY